MCRDSRVDAGTAEPAGSAAPAVIVVGGKPKIVRKARALGLDVVLFQHPAAYTEQHAAHVTSAFLFDIGDVPLAVELAATVAGRRPVRHALSLTEDGLPVAGAITDALGLPGTGAEVARLCRDKWAMRQRIADTTCGTFPGVAAELFAGEAALLRFGAAHGWPVIVKPADHSASVGVLQVTGPDEVPFTCQQVQAWRRSTEPPFHRVDRFVLEEFVDGPEISVEAFSSGGRHVVLAITEKLLTETGFVEIGHALPARLQPPVAAAVRRATAGLLDAIGLRDGPSHTEFRLSGGMPRLIETHNRVGGDRIHDLVQAATGVDQDSLWIGGPTGLLPTLPGRRPCMPPRPPGSCSPSPARWSRSKGRTRCVRTKT